MLHAILITGPDPVKAHKLAQALTKNDLSAQPDVFILTAEPSIRIKQVKALEKFLSNKPYQNDQKIVYLPQADKLTLPAQHALLKTLEEPPARSLIILVSPHQNRLLETIISRCEIHHLYTPGVSDPEFITLQQTIYSTIVGQSIGQRINFISRYFGSKITALEFCQDQLKYLRLLMLAKNQLAVSKIIKSICQTINQLNQNQNPKLVLESLIFRYPSLQGPSL